MLICTIRIPTSNARNHLLFMLVAVILASTQTHALQNGSASINGFIEDSVTKETLVGATAKIKGTKYGGYTNKSGAGQTTIAGP